MALIASKQNYEHREILLKDKPAAMLEVSPKGTVPVLVLPDGTVIDESLDVMLWAISADHPWRTGLEEKTWRSLVDDNDGRFKKSLDRYKYAVRFPEQPPEIYRDHGCEFLSKLETRLEAHQYLLAETPTLVDYAIFPFIRQFANVDIDWFSGSKYEIVVSWLNLMLKDPLFEAAMKKHPLWQADH